MRFVLTQDWLSTRAARSIYLSRLIQTSRSHLFHGRSSWTDGDEVGGAIVLADMASLSALVDRLGGASLAARYCPVGPLPFVQAWARMVGVNRVQSILGYPLSLRTFYGRDVLPYSQIQDTPQGSEIRPFSGVFLDTGCVQDQAWRDRHADVGPVWALGPAEFKPVAYCDVFVSGTMLLAAAHPHGNLSGVGNWRELVQQRSKTLLQYVSQLPNWPKNFVIRWALDPNSAQVAYVDGFDTPLGRNASEGVALWPFAKTLYQAWQEHIGHQESVPEPRRASLAVC